ncbi:MAG: MarR family winged helix-turn-helix transcriptional regulator [Marmoricola sp.]
MTRSDSLDASAALVLQVSRLIRIVRRNSHQIPAASVRLLSLVDQYGPATIKDLAITDQVSQPTMTGLVNGMTERGWLRREPNPADARSSLVSLTDAGRDELRQARAQNAEFILNRAERAGITPEDLATAASVIQRIVETEVS